MSAARLGGYLVEADPERGTFTLHSSWVENLSGTVFGLALATIIAALGVGVTGCGLWGTPGIPRKDWEWYHWPIFGALFTGAAVLGLALLWYAGCLIVGIVVRAARGFPPEVVDRGEGRVRERNRTLFELDGIDFLSVEVPDEETALAVIRFHYKDGQVRDWSGSASRRRARCEQLAHAVADFLGIPVTDRRAGSKEPIPQAVADFLGVPVTDRGAGPQEPIPES